jgi:hypothetical protein
MSNPSNERISHSIAPGSSGRGWHHPACGKPGRERLVTLHLHRKADGVVSGAKATPSVNLCRPTLVDISPGSALTAEYAALRPRRDPAGSQGHPPRSTGVTTMIVLTATIFLIIAAVVALAGVAASSGSTHSLGDDFVLSGHRLSSLSAGRLFLYGIVVGIAGLPGFSMLPGGSTRCLASPGSRRAVDGVRHETTAPRPGRDRLAGEPIQPSRVDVARPGRGLARCCGSEANIMIVSGSAAQMAVGRNSGRCGTAVRRCPASGVTAGHHGGEPCPGRRHPRQRLDQRACGRPQPCDRLGECRSPEPERTALNRPGVRRDTPSKKERL